jgi:predicted GNAT superfamily acetyltransferase
MPGYRGVKRGAGIVTAEVLTASGRVALTRRQKEVIALDVQANIDGPRGAITAVRRNNTVDKRFVMDRDDASVRRRLPAGLLATLHTMLMHSECMLRTMLMQCLHLYLRRGNRQVNDLVRKRGA